MLLCFFYSVSSWSRVVFCISKNSCLSLSRMIVSILVSISVDCFEILWKWRLGFLRGETCPKLSPRQNETWTALPPFTLLMILVCTGKNRKSTNSCCRESAPKALNYICPVLKDLGMQQKETRSTEEILTTLYPCNILVTPEKIINWLNLRRKLKQPGLTWKWDNLWLTGHAS